MNRCTDQICPLNKTICCHDCDEKECKDRCSWNSDICGNFERDELAIIEKENPKLLHEVKNFLKQKTEMDAKEKEFKTKLKEAMEKHGIKKIDNDFFTVTYVEETTRTSIDSARLKKDYPDIVKDYQKTSKVASSVRLKVK